MFVSGSVSSAKEITKSVVSKMAACQPGEITLTGSCRSRIELLSLVYGLSGLQVDLDETTRRRNDLEKIERNRHFV